jgi:hypothetical protein
MTTPDVALSQADLAALVELAPELAEDTSLTSLLGRLLDKAAALTSSTAAASICTTSSAAFMAYAIGRLAHVACQFGASGEGIPPSAQGRRRFRERTPIVVIMEIERDPEHYKAVDKATAQPTTSMIAVPLVARRTIGGNRSTAQPGRTPITSHAARRRQPGGGRGAQCAAVHDGGAHRRLWPAARFGRCRQLRGLLTLAHGWVSIRRHARYSRLTGAATGEPRRSSMNSRCWPTPSANRAAVNSSSVRLMACFAD